MMAIVNRTRDSFYDQGATYDDGPAQERVDRVVEEGAEIVDRVLQMHGGMGYTRELPVERWYRELRVLRIYEGTDEIQRRTISRNLLSGHVSVRGHLG